MVQALFGEALQLVAAVVALLALALGKGWIAARNGIEAAPYRMGHPRTMAALVASGVAWVLVLFIAVLLSLDGGPGLWVFLLFALSSEVGLQVAGRNESDA